MREHIGDAATHEWQAKSSRGLLWSLSLRSAYCFVLFFIFFLGDDDDALSLNSDASIHIRVDLVIGNENTNVLHYNMWLYKTSVWKLKTSVWKCSNFFKKYYRFGL